MDFKKTFIFMLSWAGLMRSGQPIQDLKTSFCPEFITIYVHGTTTRFGLRFLSRFCKDMAFGAPGLHSFEELPPQALLRHDAQLLYQADPVRFDIKHFYTFCWSGALSFKAREKAGKELYDALVDLLEQYQQKYGKIPKVRIWTFSHGGNVALHMVSHLPFFVDQKVYLELILVAIPVQKLTESLIEHEGIDCSYVISSTRDLMQIVDRYRFEKRKYWPARFFNTTKQNCHQIQVMINGRGLCHIDLLRSFIPHMPYILNFAQQPALSCIKASDRFICCNLNDPEFQFYSCFNLVKSVRGQRKIRKIKKTQSPQGRSSTHVVAKSKKIKKIKPKK
jgi:hypothetical protein